MEVLSAVPILLLLTAAHTPEIDRTRFSDACSLDFRHL
jgi:hypothetical protein